jgi:hypothetical protein
VLCLVIAGANVPNPLAAVYVASFGLTASVQSAMLSTYLVALVSTLAILRRGDRRRPDRVLLLAVGAGLLGAAALLAGSQSLPLLFVGRALSGVAVTSATLGLLVGDIGAGLIG